MNYMFGRGVAAAWQASPLALAAALLLAAPAAAQSNAAPTQVADASGDIIVTATKRAQDVQDVPISMAVMSGSELAQMNITSMDGAMNYLPNVYVQKTAANDTIYMRGFGSPPANLSFDQSVSLFIDGVYAGAGRQAAAKFFDLARIEVMRGPQGALFGKNTPAGAISIVSAGPTDEFEAELTGLYNLSQTGPQISGHVSGPISSVLSARVAFQFTHRDGYIDNLANGHKDPTHEDQLFRATVKYEPSDSFDYTAKFEYARIKERGGTTVSSPAHEAAQPVLSRYVPAALLGPEKNDSKSYLISGNGNLHLGEFTLQSVTGVAWFNAVRTNGYDSALPGGGTTMETVQNQYPEKFSQFSQELRLLSPTGGLLEYVAGAYFDTSAYHMHSDNEYDLPWLGYFGLQQSDYDQRAHTWSVYGQATLNLTSSLRAIGSLRYTRTKKTATFVGRTVFGQFDFRPVTTASGDKTFKNVDPSITVQYDVTPTVMVYASYGKGSKSGGFVSNTYGVVNTPVLDTFSYEGEKSRNYEVGVKSTLLDNRLVLNVSAYDLKFKDLQVSTYDPIAQTYRTGNAADATSKGIEAQVVIRPTDNFDISANGAYLDIKYDNFPGALCLVGMTPTEANGTCNLAGRRPALSSKFMGSVTAHGHFDVSAEHVVDVQATVGGRSKFFTADVQDPTYGVQKGYVKLDARIQLAKADNSWHVAVVGQNLFNKLTVSSSFLLPAPITTDPRALLYVDAPRSVALEAGIRF